MCGICGILTFDRAAGQDEYARAVRRMAARMTRRGPDDQGFWSDPGGRLQLGFRRLSILDLSRAGNQPMIAADGRSVLILNGEIYNYPELRSELEARGTVFRSTGDAEVLLEALSTWGPDAVERLNGMFAFAWYQIPERTLLLARDHAGIKPLFYHVHPAGRGVVFASQMDALLDAPWGVPGDVRPDVLRLFLRLHHVPAPYGILENTFQLEPGHRLLIGPDGRRDDRAWWVLPESPSVDLRGEAARDEVAATLERAVRRHRLADVPLGVFLSGGVDSPLVTATARRQTGPGLKAFTLANPGWDQDEAADAARYAEILDVDHRLRTVDDGDALRAIPQVVAAQTEPLADFSLLPTLWVSELARREVKVALSGDGGDELFFGYERPRSLLRDGEAFRWPWPVRAALYGAGKYGFARPRSSAIVARDPGDYYFAVNSRFRDDHLRRVAPDLAPLPRDFALYRAPPYRGRRGLADYSRRVEYYGQLQKVLKKVDMASMYHSLEVRVPILDRELVELSLRIDPFEPDGTLRRKAVLYDLLSRELPAGAITRTKLGFSVPLSGWLRRALEPLVEETLFEGSLHPAGLFDRRGLRRYWDAHRRGEADHKWGLWTLLTFQWWAREHLRPASGAS